MHYTTQNFEGKFLLRPTPLWLQLGHLTYSIIRLSMPHRTKVSRTGFPIQLKSKEVKIGNEKTSRVIIKEKLSERAVMKENGLRQVCLQERRITPKGT